MMKTHLDFESDQTKKLLCKLNFKFFLEQTLEAGTYSQKNIDDIHSSYRLVKSEIASKSSSKQLGYFMEGKVRKMFTGGFLPALFELDETRQHTIFDFPEVGRNWAYFDYWQRFYRRKVTRDKAWDFITKAGSLLAIVLSIQKLIEII